MPLYLIRYTIFIMLLLTICFRLKAQDREMMQMKHTASYTAKDSAYIINLIAASGKTQDTDIAKALKQVDTAYALSLKKVFTRGIANSLIAYAVYAGARGDYTSADSLFKRAYPYCSQYSQDSKSNYILALWFENVSIQASYQGNYQQALSYSYKALSLLEQYKADSILVKLKIQVYNSIGSMLQYLHETDQGLSYLNIGIKLALKSEDKANLAQLYINAGGAYRGKEDWAKAAAYYYKAIELSQETKSLFILQVAYLSMAAMHRNLEANDSTLVYLKKAISVSSNTNPYMSVVTPYLMMGQVYLSKKNYNLAAEYALRALNAGIGMGAKQNICDAHGLLADIYNKEEKWELAFEHQFLYARFKDSIVNERVLNNINQLNTRWQVKEKDKQLAMQKLSLGLQNSRIREKNYLLVSISAFSVLVLLFAFIAWRSYKRKQQVQESQLEITKLKAILEGEEKERKRIAVELHDGIVSQLMAVKMTLSTTRSHQYNMNAEHSANFERSIKYLDQTMQDVRITAHNLSAVTVLKYGLPVALADFCKRMNKDKTTKIVFQTYGESVPVNEHLILSSYRIVQELLQNALKHAHAQNIIVQLNQEEDLLGITVEDDGCGFNEDEIQDKKGIGLSNLKDRIKAFKGSMSIQSSSSGSSFYIEFRYCNLL